MSTLREAAKEALRWMEHARLHLTIKERMHPDGLSLYDSAAEALRAALAKPEAEAGVSWGGHNVRGDADSIAEVRRLIDFEQARQGAKPASEPQEVTVLPDGSAFGVMSFPLPIDHWLCREREYLPGKDEPVDLPRPVLTHALREHVVAAVRYAVRGATNCGMELDFDPDALVLNAVYALCGPYCREDSCDTDSPPCPDCGSSLIDVPEGSL